MKIPPVRMELGDLGYTGYFVTVPRSVKEGFVHELSGIGTEPVDGETPQQKRERDSETARDVNIKLLSLVTEWNIDDDEGQPLPLVKDITDKDPKARRAKQIAVVAEVPVEIIKAISEKVTATARVSERVQDFSPASSAPR